MITLPSVEDLRLMLFSKRQHYTKKVEKLSSSIQEKLREPILGPKTHDADTNSMPDIGFSRIATFNKVLGKIDDAIKRLDEGQYGNCIECGEPIPFKRLEAVPFTEHCVPCKTALEEQATINFNGALIRLDHQREAITI